MKLLLLGLLLSVPIVARAQTDSATAAIQSVGVEVDADSSIVDTVAIRTTVELRLREAGIHVARLGSGEKIDALFQVTVMANGDQFHGLMTVSRRLYLHPSPRSASTLAAVWAVQLSATNRGNVFKEQLEGGMDSFLNTWLEMNPHVASR